jgi:molybdopterin-guanine dinucleotide biosynthesis protein A
MGSGEPADGNCGGRRCAAVVLAGGGSRRWGGRDKTAADLSGRPVLAHVVQGLPADWPVVVVGPPDHPFAQAADPATVHWTREEPPGGGPVAGLAAGLAVLPEEVEIVVVLAGDLPFAGPAVPRLVAALSGSPADAVVGVDPGGRRQPLLGTYRTAPLRAALGTVGDAGRDGADADGTDADGTDADGDRGNGDGTSLAGRSLRSVLAGLRVEELPVSAEEAFDLDTPADLDATRS